MVPVATKKLQIEAFDDFSRKLRTADHGEAHLRSRCSVIGFQVPGGIGVLGDETSCGADFPPFHHHQAQADKVDRRTVRGLEVSTGA